MTAARIILAVALLLTLVAGSIALPAATSGPLCSMACCAGLAPHAAGSCMNGSCHSGAAVANPAANTSHQSHHHQEAQASPESDAGIPQAFSGVAAMVGGAEMGGVPTIEAPPYEPDANQGSQADASDARIRTTQNEPSAVSVTLLSKPCQADCGACASGVTAPKRSRNAAMAGDNQPRPPCSLKFASGRQSPTSARSALSRHCLSRGPPLLLSC